MSTSLTTHRSELRDLFKFLYRLPLKAISPAKIDISRGVFIVVLVLVLSANAFSLATVAPNNANKRWQEWIQRRVKR